MNDQELIARLTAERDEAREMFLVSSKLAFHYNVELSKLRQTT